MGVAGERMTDKNHIFRWYVWSNKFGDKIFYEYILFSHFYYDLRRLMMNKFRHLLYLTVLPLLLVVTEVGAWTTCSTDMWGVTTCRSNSGTTLRGSTDMWGNTNIRSNTGQTWSGSTDMWGNTNTRSNTGQTWSGSTDMWGNTNWRSSSGSRTTCSTDMWGTTTCR